MNPDTANRLAAKPASQWSDDEVFAAIEHTREQMQPTPGYNGARVAVEAVEAYWRANATTALADGVELETASAYRALAAGFTEPAPRSGFWRDLAFATLPVVAALATVSVPTQLGAAPPLALPLVGVTVSALVSLFLLLRSRELVPAWPRWRGSLGALAGGMLVAAWVGVASYDQALKAMSMKLSLAEGRMADFAVASLAAVRRDGNFLPAPSQLGEPLVALRGLLVAKPPTLRLVAAERNSTTAALYHGNTSGVPGELVLSLEPGEGKLEWRQPGKVEVRERFVVGKVGRRKEKKVEVVADSGTSLWLELNEEMPLFLAEGSCLVACFSADTHELRSFQAVGC